MQTLETTSAGYYNRTDIHAVEHFRDLARFPHESAVAHSPQLAHAARLILAQDRKLNARLLQQTCRLHSNGLQPGVEACHTSREIDNRSALLLPERHPCFE